MRQVYFPASFFSHCFSCKMTKRTWLILLLALGFCLVDSYRSIVRTGTGIRSHLGRISSDRRQRHFTVLDSQANYANRNKSISAPASSFKASVQQKISSICSKMGRKFSKANKMLACAFFLIYTIAKPFKPAEAKSIPSSNSREFKLNDQGASKISGQKLMQKKGVVEFVVAKQQQATASRVVVEDKSKPLTNVVESEVEESWNQLMHSLEGAKLDSLIMLIATSAVIPLFKYFNTSPIVGFLLTGTLLGPGGLNWIRDVHMVDTLGELGIVFFLFEMGLELSFDRLKAMRKDVFGLGTSQFVLTSAIITLAALKSGLPLPASFTIGGSLALSSSAFVLQLLKDKNAMGTRHGKASFGILLLQDLAVVPLIVVVQLLCGGGAGLGRALAVAGVKAMVTLSAMSFIGKKLLNPIFSAVARASSHEAFLSIILTTVLLMSFVTKGIGLSDTLGAFLAGILLSETSYRYQIESDIAPFRGLLLGLFFITVGFSIDLSLLIQQPLSVISALFVLILGKAGIITALSTAFGIPLASAVQAGLLNSQGGEFAFVSLGIAQRFGLIEEKLCKLLLTTVALSMALTPALSELSSLIAKKVEDNLGFAYYSGQDKGASHVKEELGSASDFVFICGYGSVGKMICDMLDRKFIRYIVLENSPQTAIEARNKGLPVFFGDIHRPEVLKHFNIGAAKACVLTLGDISATNKAVIRLRKLFPDVPIVARAKNPQHQKRLQSMFDNVYAINPAVPEDSVLLSLPFGGAVLEQVGVAKPEIDAIIDDVRRIHNQDDDEEEETKLNSLKEEIEEKDAESSSKVVLTIQTGDAQAPAEPDFIPDVRSNDMYGGLDIQQLMPDDMDLTIARDLISIDDADISRQVDFVVEEAMRKKLDQPVFSIDQTISDSDGIFPLPVPLQAPQVTDD